MCACPRAHCLSAFEIDAIIFTFFFRVPNEKLSLSLSLSHINSLVSFFCRGEKKRQKKSTRRTNTKDESRTRAVAARR